ncbi:MAG: hypothetical protein AB1505_05055 [Candidatus Latescibacterota bacterium]
MTEEERIGDCYQPIPGGWRICITDDPAAAHLAPGERIGVVCALPGTTGHEHNPESERRPARDDARRQRRGDQRRPTAGRCIARWAGPGRDPSRLRAHGGQPAAVTRKRLPIAPGLRILWGAAGHATGSMPWPPP